MDSEELQRLADYDREAQRQLREKLDELDRLNRELQAQVREMVESGARQEQIERREAEKECRNAKEAVSKCEETSHAFFLPGQLDLHRSQAVKAVQMISDGMFSAAMATAVSVCTDVRVLILNVEQQEQEWARLLAEYEARIRHLEEMLSAFEQERHETVYTDRERMPGHLLDEARLSFWSSGMYVPVRDGIALASGMLEEIRQQGIRAYLRREDAMQKRLLVKKISQCREMEDRLTAVITCVRSEIKFSDERYVAGELTADALENLGYTVTDSSFRKRDGYECPLDAFEVTARLTEGATVRVLYYPVRRDGVAIRNECLITVSLTRLTERTVYQSMARQWQSRISSLLRANGIGAMTVSARQGDEPAGVQLMPPEPEAYARRIAMKY